VEINGLSEEDSKSSKKVKLMSWIIFKQEKLLVENAKLNICVSDGIRNAIKQRYPKQKTAVTILNGVASKFFQEVREIHTNKSSERLKIIYVGTFTPWDGAADIISLANSFHFMDFIMVGEGELKHRIEASAPSNVIFLGEVDYVRLPKIYEEADAGIALYEFERHKNVEVSSIKTLEYVASALPIFTTDIPGQSFVNEEGIGYLLSENEDINDGFRRFINNINIYSSNYLGKKDYFSRRFGWQRTAEKTAEYMWSLLGRTVNF
jgi:glycosyltransferase involved in cell wall biosynthesis